MLAVIAGPNGAGKTALTSQLLLHKWLSGCTYINPDYIARDTFGDWNSPDAVMQAAVLARKQREKCLANKENLAFESVLSACDKIEFLKRAKDAGYFIRLFFIGTSHPSINAARVAQRVMEGGHDVPIPKIISRYTKSIANCAAAASFSDRAYIYDNSVDGRAPSLIFRTRQGKIKKVYNKILPWAQVIADTMSRVHTHKSHLSFETEDIYHGFSM
jgi:predicted ABC-type ATPase